jgi:hypothetical protein
LPRLKDQTQSSDATPLARTKFADTDLVANVVAGSHAGEKYGAKFLSLDAVADWSQPLRGKGKDTLFVSFSVYGSAGTILEIGGAKVGIVDSEIAHYAQLVVSEPSATGPKWRQLGLHAPLEPYNGQPMASFTVLTVRLDPADGTWDLFHGTCMLAEDLPLNAATKHAQFIVHAGETGAQVNGLVQSDENPLYEDANANGIDDRFEQSAKGRLLAASDTKADRKELIKVWRAHQITEKPAALFVNLPRPDGK